MKLRVPVLIMIAAILFVSCGPLPRTKPYDGKQVIRLKFRTFAPKPGLETRLAERFRKVVPDSIIHVLMQFEVMPSLAERRILTDSFGVRLLDPVPEQAFFVSMRPDASLAKQLLGWRGRIRWIGRLKPEDKLAPRIFPDKIPEHARRPKGMAEVIVQFFGDVRENNQRTILDKHGARNITRILPINGWQVILPIKVLQLLATEDPVKWIVEIPAPPEDDNDGVRSATGVDVDPILPPSAYNLSGNGIIVAQWEGKNASATHNDFGGRIVLADPPLPAYSRTHMHDESVTANGQFDNGEGIYRDLDDNVFVSVGDVRATAVAGFAAGTSVNPGDIDLTTALVDFVRSSSATFPPTIGERFTDNVTVDRAYTAGEGIYLDNDLNFYVSVNDTRLTAVGVFPVGSVVALGDADIGIYLYSFPFNPHYHSTHVAGTVMGSGIQSAAQGGTLNQWKGVAPAATLRSYGTFNRFVEYIDAANNNAEISTNSWGTSHSHQVSPPNRDYDVESEFLDAVISGVRSDGTSSGLVRRILFVGSAGNQGRPERFTENVTLNGAFDNGESIYRDRDDDGVVSGADILRLGTAQPIGTPLVNFNLNEMHDETINVFGRYETGEGIYFDADASRTVSIGDTRIISSAGYPAGSGVVIADVDIGTNLRQFKLWGNVRIPNSAKNTIEVANIASDARTLSPSSSRGPTDDGRIKPDLAGPGSENGGDGAVTSTLPRNLYIGLAGTSMSTPAVSGCAALLSEWYKSACVTAGPNPDVLKAILIHSSEDLTSIPNVTGTFDGPDFAFGFGRVRVKEAVDLLTHHRVGTSSIIGNIDYSVTLGEMRPLKVTLVWNDPAWTANAAPSPTTGILQNDLDLLLIAPDGTQYTPWIASGANPSAPATRSSIPSGGSIPVSARDRRNTVEQVQVDIAMPGTWTIRVTASTLNLPSQNFVLVSEALPPEAGPCASTPAADVWMKDNPDDDGSVLSSGAMYLGPDLWNRLTEDGLTSHENPEYGQLNFLYANIRNASAVAVSATTIDVWLGYASLGLIWPDNFQHVGRFAVPNLGPSEVRLVGPLEWEPPNPDPSNHFCLYMRVMSPQDPITYVEGTGIWANAQNSNNIAYRNIIVVDLASSRSITFLVRNVEKEDVTADIEFHIPKEFLLAGRIQLKMSLELNKLWPDSARAERGLVYLSEYNFVPYQPNESRVTKQIQEIQVEQIPVPLYQLTDTLVRLRSLKFGPKQAERLTLTFFSDKREKAIYEVDVVEKVAGQIRGGIRFLVRTGYIQEE